MSQIRVVFRWTRCKISIQIRHKIANTLRYLQLIKPKIWQVKWTKTASNNTNRFQITIRVKMAYLFRQDPIETVLSSSRPSNRRTAETIWQTVRRFRHPRIRHSGIMTKMVEAWTSRSKRIPETTATLKIFIEVTSKRDQWCRMLNNSIRGSYR